MLTFMYIRSTTLSSPPCCLWSMANCGITQKVAYSEVLISSVSERGSNEIIPYNMFQVY